MEKWKLDLKLAVFVLGIFITCFSSAEEKSCPDKTKPIDITTPEVSDIWYDVESARSKALEKALKKAEALATYGIEEESINPCDVGCDYDGFSYKFDATSSLTGSGTRGDDEELFQKHCKATFRTHAGFSKEEDKRETDAELDEICKNKTPMKAWASAIGSAKGTFYFVCGEKDASTPSTGGPNGPGFMPNPNYFAKELARVLKELKKENRLPVLQNQPLLQTPTEALGDQLIEQYESQRESRTQFEMPAREADK